MIEIHSSLDSLVFFIGKIFPNIKLGGYKFSRSDIDLIINMSSNKVPKLYIDFMCNIVDEFNEIPFLGEDQEFIFKKIKDYALTISNKNYLLISTHKHPESSPMACDLFIDIKNSNDNTVELVHIASELDNPSALDWVNPIPNKYNLLDYMFYQTLIYFKNKNQMQAIIMSGSSTENSGVLFYQKIINSLKKYQDISFLFKLNSFDIFLSCDTSTCIIIEPEDDVIVVSVFSRLETIKNITGFILDQIPDLTIYFSEDEIEN
jgi:hypothetical protein